MDSLPRRETMTFVLRVWAEYLRQSPPSWRGEIEQVGGGRRFYFGSLEEMALCLCRCLPAQPTDKQEEDR